MGPLGNLFNFFYKLCTQTISHLAWIAGYSDTITWVNVGNLYLLNGNQTRNLAEVILWLNPIFALRFCLHLVAFLFASCCILICVLLHSYFLFYYLVHPIWFIQELKREWVVKGKSGKHHTKAYIKSIKHKCTTTKERNTWVECGEVMNLFFKITTKFFVP